MCKCECCGVILTEDDACCDGVVCGVCGHTAHGRLCDGHCDECSDDEADAQQTVMRWWIRAGGDDEGRKGR